MLVILCIFSKLLSSLFLRYLSYQWATAGKRVIKRPNKKGGDSGILAEFKKPLLIQIGSRFFQDLSIIWFVDDRVSPTEVTRTAAWSRIGHLFSQIPQPMQRFGST
ncbi:hypothetical protein NBG4_920009 [Candidatus Sulfobium mesophilum]|uniref:Uncharacterized protein n=1 Tax=Candidatus Sulfobium mesophilum TaxID=2016548 RepID=A0A2U3QL63_9BACT|nr:hypothetical protein NBG4_920009 [Candidatus Sulfobium mesophilum]